MSKADEKKEKEIKEAIDDLSYFEPDNLMEFSLYQDCVGKIYDLLDLYQKQQKEIEELKEQNKKHQGIEEGTTIIYKAKAKYIREDKIEKYYINKNKIREKIKEYEEHNYQEEAGALRKLLEE